MGNGLRRVVGRKKSTNKRRKSSRSGGGDRLSFRQRHRLRSNANEDDNDQSNHRLIDHEDDFFDWYYVKQQLDKARALGSNYSSPFAATLLLDIKLKIVKEMEKFDGFESARRSFAASGADKFNSHVLAVLCATCFSQCEQQELIELLLNTKELVTCDDVYCALFEAGSFALVSRLLDAASSSSSTLSASLAKKDKNQNELLVN